MRFSVTFDSVKIRKQKTGICPCGKKITRSKTFEQTINPYNTNKDGKQKTEEEILVELNAEADEWLKEPIHHDIDNHYLFNKDRENYRKYSAGEKVTVKLECGAYSEVKKYRHE
jgi:hypothetical protein